MDIRMEFLKTLGFVTAGHWVMLDGKPHCNLYQAIGAKKNALYAFSVDNTLMYLGITTLQLKERFRRYAHPPKRANNGGGTNIKNNRNIKEALLAGKVVQILAMPELYTVEENTLLIRLLKSAEDQLISLLRPAWNG